MGSKKNDLPDINKIIGEYGDSLLRMSFLYLKDYHLAEDAVQDTLLKVYRGYSSFNGKSSEKTWIMRIAINVCKNYLRSNWWKRIDAEAVLETIPATEAEMIQDDTLLRVIMSLPVKYREIILLYYYQELKIHEIAEVLHIPESTASIRLKRARERLKSELKGDYCYE
ncbi:RNA polymerase sigma-70 factor (ECF subfamily) [Ruminiclostridium sufflavum DSM 19573]|uniref:RNA polymerase sigma-70 factor (ECF subfamily) n=1 Tax=Ruminiclostridium sufflavum DSM 19573 TaxID=1121337 RepID=A0A318XP94_9FIRM|nr:sigma-70 family RNA polymerase sigma factor [Ruminiclostridium sufflavum]PYG88875.1 RNA polymerase sigma-70 factor (ECF subfamily) [Ruminiclostridium sufflavum DSM 19573]